MAVRLQKRADTRKKTYTWRRDLKGKKRFLFTVKGINMHHSHTNIFGQHLLRQVRPPNGHLGKRPRKPEDRRFFVGFIFLWMWAGYAPSIPAWTSPFKVTWVARFFNLMMTVSFVSIYSFIFIHLIGISFSKQSAVIRTVEANAFTLTFYSLPQSHHTPAKTNLDTQHRLTGRRI